MTDKKFPKSELPIRKTSEFLPQIFQTDANDKFLSAALDPWIQPGTLEKLVGYVGKRYGKTYRSSDVYLDNDETLRSRYQLEPAVVYKKNNKIEKFYDYLDLKNMLKFFGNIEERDDKIMDQEHFSWNPPIDWDKFINYREYYWVPTGPTPLRVLGQTQSVVSTYKVKLGEVESYIFSPDGFTNNPTITLYRGQTYNFVINAPNNGMAIRRNYDTGSLAYDSTRLYKAGELAIYDEKLWRAIRDIFPEDGSSIDVDSDDWELVDNGTATSILDYTKGVTNNGVSNGTLTFKVPNDAPDVLYYQSIIEPDRLGRFLIADIESNTKIDVDKEISGKENYSSSNGIDFSNGMIVNFGGQVTPEKYSTGNWLVEGVGKNISLTLFTDLVIPILSTDIPEVLFDNDGFDSVPFDDASAYPGSKDYITINKSSTDKNPWSRYNRWFHRSVLEYSSRLSNSDFDAREELRAKRPIIEFLSDLQLYNHGAVAKETVDFIDKFTLDVFSTIEGSSGYNVDGEPLFDGARLLVVADTDSLANNRIYKVKFINHNGSRQITLTNIEDTEPIKGEAVLIRRGNQFQGKMFWYNGTSWLQSQDKTSVNQAPMFDAFDENGISFSDKEKYPVSTFQGSKILSYTLGNGRTDTELGFPISYLNIDNVGDIQFSYDWEIQTFSFEENSTNVSSPISSGYFYFHNTDQYDNGWLKLDNTYIQPVVDFLTIKSATNTIIFDSVDWNQFDRSSLQEIYVYKNGIKIPETSWQRSDKIFTFTTSFNEDDEVSIKIFSEADPNRGFYEFPLGLEKNPLNKDISLFTLGQASDHVYSGIEFSADFEGSFPGQSNLRDLDLYRFKSKRFVKHSVPSPIVLTSLVDQQSNIIKALKFTKKSYTEFRNIFLKIAENLYTDQLPLNFVDDILEEYTRSKTSANVFAGSDMIGNGAYNSKKYVVEDTGIVTFALSKKFSLNVESTDAVYVYVNNQQLLHFVDYEFNDILGFVTIKKELFEGDELEIREYTSTSSCFIPPTPTKLGLFKKYTPRIYVDDTFRVPKKVIQCHDGSRLVAFDDFRDNVILEIEKRIYNNIKIPYDENLFDIDLELSNYYGGGRWTREQFLPLLSQEFLTWVSDTNLDYINNLYFDSEESFTYTYSEMTDPASTTKLPGYWRGVYKWFYDTDRPHLCPWEMLGFSEKPDWWEEEYGPAPYTRGNLILWEDIQTGIIKHGPRQGIYARYAHPGILNHLPVDDEGQLLSPLDSNLAKEFVLINNKGDFKLGDLGPVEYSWYMSPEYPFSIIIAVALLSPFRFLSFGLSSGKLVRNRLNQLVSKASNKFIKKEDIVTGSNLNFYYILSQYIKSQKYESTELDEIFSNLDVSLSHRLSGFVDKDQQRFLLDSKNPKSTSSSVFVPDENYQIIFNKSSPISITTYSGVIVEKVNTGFKITGYDSVVPKFTYREAYVSQADYPLSVGGVSERYSEWTSGSFYNNGAVALYLNNFYRSISSHTAGDTFDTTLWRKLPSLPTVGAVEILRRRNFQSKESYLPYGTILPTVQSVVDFLLGYQEHLISLGFIFEEYDAELQGSKDWLTSSKEFMYWTQHNWAEGSLIVLSPSAEKINFNYQIGVPDNILDSFYNYEVKRGDGTSIPTNFINVKRSYQNFVIESISEDFGIYFIKLYQILKEHVVVFDQRTIFNDIIYDQTSGYRQERIKSRGFRTVDWDGNFITPGLIYDDAKIQDWQPFVDYNLGDIVFYKGYNWTSKRNQTSDELFDEINWEKLDTEVKQQLIPNFDFRINQFEDFYNLDNDGLQSSQQNLGRHAIGYQKRNYLENLSEDSVTQFKIYQGFIRDKGTANAAVKIFDKLSRSEDDSIILNEEWAIKSATVGGVEQYNEVEFQVRKNQFKLTPQPVLLSDESSRSLTDRYLRIPTAAISSIDDITDKKVFETSYQNIRSAGYVNLNDVDFVISRKELISSIDIMQTKINDTIFVTFDTPDWNVYQIVLVPLIHIISAEKIDDTVVINFNRLHNLEVGQYVGIRNVPNLTGFFEVIDKDFRTITLSVPASSKDPEIDESTITRIFNVKSVRYLTEDNITPEIASLLTAGSKLFIDDADNEWKVLEKNKVYFSKDILDYGVSSPLHTGYAVKYADILLQTIVGMPGENIVNIYQEGQTGLAIKQIILPDSTQRPKLGNSFGRSLAVSPDNRWLAVGVPLASGLPSGFVGIYDPSAFYSAGDIVAYKGRLWKAVRDVTGDGSTLNVNLVDWEIADIIRYNSDGNGSGYIKQGCVYLYRWNGQRWDPDGIILSPSPDDYEEFGSQVSLAYNGDEYILAVSAPGSLNNRGRVYLFNYQNNSWKNHVNRNYQGVYDPESTYYIKDDIVWYRGELYRFLDTSSAGDGSTLSIDNNDWIRIDPISTHSSLPTNVAIEDDGSTLASGILSPDDLAELTKAGEKFGSSIAFNKDGSVLVVGVPDGDEQWFPNYKGIWRSDYEYLEGDVVKYQGTYHELVDIRLDVPSTDFTINYSYVITELGTTDWNQVAGTGEYADEPTENIIYEIGDIVVSKVNGAAGTGKGVEGTDSSVKSFNEAPDAGLPWTNIGDSSNYISGKVFVYKRDEFGLYKLAQTFTGRSIREINDIGDDSAVNIQLGDGLGFSVDIDQVGVNIVVGSPYADIDLQSQGVAYVFSNRNINENEWRLVQKIQVTEEYSNSLFGSSVSISPTSDRIGIGAKNAGYRRFAYFNDETSFDSGTTSFSEFIGYTGQTYIFERLGGKYILAEKLENNLQDNESFGSSLDVSGSVIIVGSPTYTFNSRQAGFVRLFRKDSSINSFTILNKEEPIVDITKIKNVFILDESTNIKTNVEIIDPVKGKISGLADQEIKFKTPYDPASYTNGTDDVIVDADSAWLEKNVGALWWDISKAKWYYYEQDGLDYRIGNWSNLAEGASIDVYEWVETKLLPSEWSALADTADGLSQNISGQPLYPDDDVYSEKILYNVSTEQITETLYYYWVKNSTLVPVNSNTRNLSAANVAQLILNPASSGDPIISVIRDDCFICYNFFETISSDHAYINIEFFKDLTDLTNPIYRQYKLVKEGVAESFPSIDVENKWIDSLIGFNSTGQVVPDTNLPENKKYGISFRPRQTMFRNRLEALNLVITRVNSILLIEPFADILNFKNLNLVDQPPDVRLNEYDIEVDSFADLSQISDVLSDFFPNRVKQAILRANLINGEVDTIDIVDPGFGYKTIPFINIVGAGSGASAEITLDNQGRVNSVKVITRGKKYESAIVQIRPYTILVKNDETINGFWSLYSWDQIRRQFYRTGTQGYDVRKYWEYINWWKEGFGENSRIIKEIDTYYQEVSLDTKKDDLIKINEFGNGGWAVLLRIDGGEIDNKYTLVGRQQGTIRFLETLYNSDVTPLGFDAVDLYDAGTYDSNPSNELRIILKAIKEDILINDYRSEWNQLFFTSLRYILNENFYASDWFFKTSFISALHNVGNLDQKLNFKNDNLDAYEDYLNEIKPFKTTIREFVSKYTSIDNTNSEVTDFDLPSFVDPVSGNLTTITKNSNLLSSPPWKYWNDNRGFEITDIILAKNGSGYTDPPRVVIEGTGTGAKAQAFISNGKVTGIRMLNSGTGYTASPKVSLVGGNGSQGIEAKAVAILGNSKSRTFDLKVKFDRITKSGYFSSFIKEDTFVATGTSNVFDLSYPPIEDKSKIGVFINDQLVLNDEFQIQYFIKEINGSGFLKARLLFNNNLELGSIIFVRYEKNNEILDAVNRINRYYAPTDGMIGSDLSQLLTGIDFGGVEIQGTTFEVTGGWDALPWFTDGWDSVESNADYYVVADGSTNFVNLPYVPQEGQLISIYLKRVDESTNATIDNLQYSTQSAPTRTIRIDDQYYELYDGTTTQPNGRVTPPENALMPTFVGDGSTTRIEIGDYVSTEPGDVLIFRPFESDGSVIIRDPNIIDTEISGGTFAAINGIVSTATGRTAEEISIHGGEFISPEKVPAPEENVPGQVLDSLSFKVFQVTPTGASPVIDKIYLSDGSTLRYSIGIELVSEQNVLVYVDGTKLEFAQDSSIDYSIDFETNEIILGVAPAENSLIEIFAISIGGISIIDVIAFNSDGANRYFLTKADYVDTESVLVTVNGVQVDLDFFNSTNINEEEGTSFEPDKTLIIFASVPNENDIIKIITFGTSLDTDSSGLSFIKINNQNYVYDGINRSFNVDEFVPLSRGSDLSSIIVEVNNLKLQGPDTYYRIYDGTNNIIPVGNDPDTTVTSVNVRVYINNILQPFVTAYVYDGTNKTVIVNATFLNFNDEIKIELDNTALYSIDNDVLTLDESIILNSDDRISVTWFSEYPTLDVISDVYTGGKVKYRLKRRPISTSSIWVYFNGRRLTREKEFRVESGTNNVYINFESNSNDRFEILEFDNDIYKAPRGFEIYKDMLNLSYYKRFGINQVELTRELNYYDLEIHVNDGSLLDAPEPLKNISGIVQIGTEKIQYLNKSGNVLSQLRRGVLGSPIENSLPVGTSVVNLGKSELIPYVDTQERADFVSDGSSLIIGPLEYIPIKSERATWSRETIPTEFGACDMLEVFVGGTRLRKDSLTVFDENINYTSPDGDRVLEAEFSVDGSTAFIRLTSAPPAGTRIRIIRKIGRLWYDQGIETASRGITLLDNESAIAKFIDRKNTLLP